MIVLHAIWDSCGALHLWAESSASLERVSGRLRKPVGGDGDVRPHPFVLAQTELSAALGEFVCDLSLEGARSASLALRLPSTTRGPLSSPELLLTETATVAPAGLTWWSIPTLSLDASHTFDFLLTLSESPARGLVFGSSLCFWSEVARFAFELITRQRFIPEVEESQQDGALAYRAVWKIVPTPDERERLQVLTRALPPLCWSFLPPGSQPFSRLQAMVLHLINSCVDAFVRESLLAGSFLPSTRKKRSAALPELWLRTLASAEPSLTAPVEDVTAFVATLRSWLDQLQGAGVEAPFRTCFKLDPPAPDSEEQDLWQISFHLQANDDRSLLIPAEAAWQERSGTLTFLQRKFENPQERLLADLGKASRLFPALDKSLKSAHPHALAVNTLQAYNFLRETAPLLEDSGFGVMVPPWWQKAAARVGVKLKVRSTEKSQSQTSPGLMGLDSIIAYDWNVAIGDTTITAEEFEQLVSLKQPLINVRGQWVELRSDEIEAAIAFFQKKRAKREMSLGDALRIGLGQEKSEPGLAVVGLEAEGPLQEILDSLSQKVQLTAVTVPTGFHGQLRPYQQKGLSWLAFLKQFGFGACLADDMGLGKTCQLICLLLLKRDQNTADLPIDPTLVICPMSIVGNWQRELQRFAPSLSVMIHHGMERLSGEEFIAEARRHAVVITTYALALRDKEHLSAIAWDNVVVDEAQNIKNENAKQTQAIKSLKAQCKIALTGTPVENRLAELWSIMEFLNPSYLGSATDFRKSFALPIERYRNAERAEVLKKLIQPFVLRRLKTDKEIIQDLPEKMEMKVFCNLTQEQASLYEAVVKEMLAKIEVADGIERRGLVLASLMKLKQVCNHPAQFMSDSSSLQRRSGKLSRLEAMLEELLASGEKALIFTQFAEMGHLLRHYLQATLGCEVLFLHGGSTKKQRDMMVQRFQEERRAAPIFILSLKAGGVGLNLTAANHVFHFDRWWNPAVENQATDRAFRIGQQKNVQVHKFVCVGTLEERIDQLIEQKKELAESIVGSGEGWLTEMSTDQLKDLFALSQEAVGE